jgi:spermidine/putrescine transport system permease protein
VSSATVGDRPKARRFRRKTEVGSEPWSPKAFWQALAAPAAVFLLVFFAFPFYVVVAVTFGSVDPILRQPVPAWNPTTWNLGIIRFTLSNMFHSDGLYYGPFVHTFVFIAVTAVLCLLIGYPFAYFLARRAGRYRGLFVALFFAPFWVSYMLRMLAWISLLQTDGYVNRTLIKLGILQTPYPWLSGKPGTVILGLTYGYVPFMVLPLFATLDRIPESQLEAGRDLGASPALTFFRVTLPQSRQAILAGFVLCILPMFGDYYTQQLLAGTTNTMMIGNVIVNSLTIPIFVSRGAALILVLLILLIPPIIYYLRSTNRATQELGA